MAAAKTITDNRFSDLLAQPSCDNESSEGGSCLTEVEGNASASGRSTTGTTDSTTRDDVAAVMETRAVNRIKLVVLVVLVTSALGVALSAYFYLSGSENGVFKREFEDDSNKILQAIGASLDKRLASLDGVSVTLVSHARSSGQQWPFVVVPDFALRMSKVLPVSDAFVLSVLPLVTPETRDEWEAFSIQNDSWVDESIAFQETWSGYHGPVIYGGEKKGVVHGDFDDIPRNISRAMLPLWQNFPVLPNSTYTYNWDWLSMSIAQPLFLCLKSHRAVISAPYMIPPPDDEVAIAETAAWSELFTNFIGPEEEAMEPISDLYYPIIDDASRAHQNDTSGYNKGNGSIVGQLVAQFYWRAMIRDILPKDSRGIQIVFSNNCTESFSYQVNGDRVEYLGVRDHHDTSYDDMGVHHKLSNLGKFSTRDSVYSGVELEQEFCPMTLSLYPSDEMRDRFTSANPIIFTVAVVAIFAFTSFVFYVYDSKVERRQEKVMRTAASASAIVSSLFPAAVRDRLYPTEQTAAVPQARALLKNFVRGSQIDNGDSAESSVASIRNSSPIAELYPDTTVLFADIAGFTAWSSSRSPTQVFHLLETLYAGFDAIARQRGVFKVETIGDCYVAVAGLPTPRKNHAVIMARFASDCRHEMKRLTAELEKELGVGTADLAIRIGLNSGPTTAGVLRGEKSRFQLFGDTVNTAARMESTGERNRIQVSQKTADLITIAGKAHWLTPRDEPVQCKGKGKMSTYWCEPRSAASNGSVSDESNAESVDVAAASAAAGPSQMDDKKARLVDWNVDLFHRLLQEIVLHSSDKAKPLEILNVGECTTGLPVDEVAEVLDLTTATKTGHRPNASYKDSTISKAASLQLRACIESIANAYRPHPFHNFEHCSHVAMSTWKLLHRIDEEAKGGGNGSGNLVTFDPLTKFAIVFAALIHDVDHPGVSNAQLIKEDDPLAAKYSKSIAEQNSIDLAWTIFADPKYADLHGALFASQREVQRFRQVVVNAVMATDLFDKDLSGLRDLRWKQSFDAAAASSNLATLECQNRRATIIVDLIIQASDVSHTMQHFTVYKKWNQSLMQEMYIAFQKGRMPKDPTIGWYDGELWFFDNYVIPLAQKLKECGVFGVSCDEFLDYARDNRLEWEAKGRMIVDDAKNALVEEEEERKRHHSMEEERFQI